MTANASRSMLPLQSLLNPTSSNPTTLHRGHAVIPSPSGSDTTAVSSSTLDEAISAGPRSEPSNILAKAKPRGPVNFPPFENIDGTALHHVMRFQVTPFGQIHRGFQHIPYSSSKKDLFEKTGRESIEAFRYEFRVPGHERVYVVMWDYNIGIVRMNPFIKWGGFPKTKSSQMLDKNPGLRNISPGITGGAVTAQGYWVPYRCARALCATFCHPIAGALIPLFGPTFPDECIPPDSPAYNEMLISRQLLTEDAQRAEIDRRFHMNKTLEARNAVTSHPRPDHCTFHGPLEHGVYASRFVSPIHQENAWPSSYPPTDYHPSVKQAWTTGTSPHLYKMPAHSGARFTPANLPSPEEDPFEHADPYLSAMPPRQPPPGTPQPEALQASHWVAKRRRLNHLGDQQWRENTAPQLSSPSSSAVMIEKAKKDEPTPRTLAHYNAAMVLVTLSSKDEEAKVMEEVPDSKVAEPSKVAPESLPRNKRQRAKSF